MSLRFIYGRAGSGKTKFCLDDIKLNLRGKDIHPLILLVPEQYTFQTEKSLIETREKDVNLRTEVLSFKRLAYRVFSEVGGLSRQHMGEAGRAMLIYKIIEETKSNLKAFVKSARQQGFIGTISDIIVEFKRYDVPPELLIEAVERVDENKGLREKLEDIGLIYSEFNKKLHERYIDSEDDLTILYEKLDMSKQFNEAEIYLDGFTSFTPQQYKVIEKLLKKCRRVNITLCTDSSSKDSGYDNTEVFATTKATEERIIGIAMDNNVSLDEPVNLNGDKIKRFKDSPEIAHLERHLFSFPYKEFKGKTENISIFKSVNIYSEIEETARNIVEYVRDKELRFSDIVVAGRDLNLYEKIIGAVFTEHDIPYFLNMKRDIKSNPLVVLILSALDMYTKRWSYESVFRYLKTGLLNIDMDDINIIENYILANGIRGKKWADERWDYRISTGSINEDISQEELDKISRINEIKDEITKPLLEFHSQIGGKITVKEVAEGLYSFLTEINAPQKMEDVILNFRNNREFDIANEYSQVWDIVIDVLDQIVDVMGDEEVEVNEFVKILTIGFEQYEIGVIPPAIDQVLITSVDRMKSHNAKQLFIIGVNDGVFPRMIKDEGILSDIDREDLMEIGIELSKDTRARAFEEQYLIYTALTSTCRSLKLSYPIADHEGRTMRPSMIISRVKKLFPDISEHSNIIKKETEKEQINMISTPAATFNLMITELKEDSTEDIYSIWEDVYRWYKKRDTWKDRVDSVMKGLTYTNQVAAITSERAKHIYGENMYFSVSRLESYAKCPFAYFIQYGIKVRERKIFEFSAPDMGTFMHNVLNEFSRYMIEGKIAWDDVEKEWCEEKISLIVDEMINRIPNFILNSSPRYKYMSKKIKDILTTAIWIIAESIKNSSFKPTGFEVDFGRGGEYPPIKICLENGKEINLMGRIDRLDTLDKGDNAYVRVIDYKSGNKEFSLSDIYYGLELQLLTYLDAIVEGAKRKSGRLYPAAMLYFRLDDPMIRSARDMSNEDIENEIRKKLKMQGLVLKDDEILKEMDYDIKNDGESKTIPVKFKDGTIKDDRSTATLHQFDILREHIKDKIASLCEEMYRGKIEIRPFKKKDKTPCDYCKYSSICQFDSGIKDNKYKIIGEKKPQEVWQLLEMEKGKEGECDGE